MQSRSILVLVLACAPVLAATACKKKPSAADLAAASASADASGAPAPIAAAASAIVIAKEPKEWVPPDGPILGAIAGQVNIFATPSLEAKRIGYVRLGAMVKRERSGISPLRASGAGTRPCAKVW